MSLSSSPIQPPTLEMLRAMLALQDGMNKKINPDWITAGYPFLRAVLVEAVEGLEHYGWKWWKSQTPDISQLKIELIDIWHFLLSHYLVDVSGDLSKAAIRVKDDWARSAQIEFDGRRFDVNALGIGEKLELMAAMAGARRNVTVIVAHLFRDCELTTDQLFREYVSKNVLNHFRQDHGYKTGTYKKMWDGLEDNVHLAELLRSINVNEESLAEALYRSLESRYSEVLAAGRAF
jgi:dimeric dUTPase (all-alpha-NTP-PPase superfamily)